MPVDAREALLCWYAVDKRRLPWRAETGARPDPYRVWLSEVMLQQTTVAAVKPYFERFTMRWPTVTALAEAEDGALMAAWAGLGYYARARNLLACARAVVADHGGRFPEDEAELRTLPGIGAYTAAAIAAIAFGKRAVVVDGNVERVIARLHALAQALPAARPGSRARRCDDSGEGAGDFAQAMMDWAPHLHPRSPDCGRCPIRPIARVGRGRPEAYPSSCPRPSARIAGAPLIGSNMTGMCCSSAGRPRACSAGCSLCPRRSRRRRNGAMPARLTMSSPISRSP